MTQIKYTFDSEIKAGRNGGAFVEFPFDVAVEFQTKGRVKVNAMINNAAYRGSIVPMGGKHILGITKAVRSAIDRDIGDTVHLVVTQDLAERQVDVPEDLDSALDATPQARINFENLAFTYRKEFAKWITDARKIETRERRLKKAISMIINGDKL